MDFKEFSRTLEGLFESSVGVNHYDINFPPPGFYSLLELFFIKKYHPEVFFLLTRLGFIDDNPKSDHYPAVPITEQGLAGLLASKEMGAYVKPLLQTLKNLELITKPEDVIGWGGRIYIAPGLFNKQVLNPPSITLFPQGLEANESGENVLEIHCSQKYSAGPESPVNSILYVRRYKTSPHADNRLQLYNSRAQPLPIPPEALDRLTLNVQPNPSKHIRGCNITFNLGEQGICDLSGRDSMDPLHYVNLKHNPEPTPEELQAAMNNIAVSLGLQPQDISPTEFTPANVLAAIINTSNPILQLTPAA